MNRNFVKISVSIIALAIALVLCLAGCKVDDVANDLGTVKDEIAANKADAAKALEEATKALEDKIAANNTDVATEIAALGDSLSAAKTQSGAADEKLEAAIQKAEATLTAAIGAVKKELSETISANQADVNAKVAAINAAIANAEAVLKAADKKLAATLTYEIAALQTTVDAALAEINNSVELLKADVENKTQALNNKIAAGDADLAEEIVKLSAAIEAAEANAADADTALKTALTQAIANANAAMTIAVNNVKADLDVKINNLENKLNSKDADIAAEIAALQVALKNANDAAVAANATLETTLSQAIANAQKALETSIETVKKTLTEKIDNLTKKMSDTDGALTTDIIELQEALTAAKTALSAEDETLAGLIAAGDKVLQDAIDAINGKLDGFEDATAYIITAWQEMYKVNSLWASAGYTDLYLVNDSGDKTTDIDLDKIYAEYQVKLLRATTIDEATKVRNNYFKTMKNVRSESLELLTEVYYEYVIPSNNELKKDDTDLEQVRSWLDQAKSILDNNFSGKDALLIVPEIQEQIDVDTAFKNTWAAYDDERVAEVTALLDSVKAKLDAAQKYVDADSYSVFAEINDILADADIAVKALEADAEVYELSEAAELRTRFNNLSIASIEKQNTFIFNQIDGSTIENLNDVDAHIANVEADIAKLTVDATVVTGQLNNNKKAKVEKLISFISAYYTGADLTMDNIDGMDDKTAEAQIAIDALTSDAHKAALNESLNNVRIQKIKKINAFAKAEIEAATDMETLNAVDTKITTAENAIAALVGATEAQANDVNADLNSVKIAKVDKEQSFINDAIVAIADDVTTDAEVFASIKAALEASKVNVDAAAKIDTEGKLAGEQNRLIGEVIKAYLGAVEIEIAVIEVSADISKIDNKLQPVQVEIKKLIAADATMGDAAKAEYDAVWTARNDKYVALAAAEINAEMVEYVDNFAAIKTEVDNGTTEIADIRAAYESLKGAFSEYFAETDPVESEVAFQKVETQRDALAQLINDADDVAVILDNAEFDEVTGNEVEFELINDYKAARDAWVVRLEALGFTSNENNDATKATVRALIDETTFDTIEAAFNDKVSVRKTDAEAMISTIGALQTEIGVGAEAKYTIAVIESINAAYQALEDYDSYSTDPNGIGFILAWVSNGAKTRDGLVEVLNGYATGYKNYIAAAKAAWADCYTDAGVDKLVAGTESLTVYETRLAAVQQWFVDYGPAVSQNYLDTTTVGIAGVTINSGLGTTDIKAEIEALEAELAQLIEDAKAEAASINDRIAALGTDAITTEDETEINSIGAAIEAYFANTEYSVNEANPGEGFEIDNDALEAASAALNALKAELKGIQDDIAALNPDLDYNKYPATLGYADADAAEEAVDAIEARIATFITNNSGIDKITEAEYNHLADIDAAVAEFRRQGEFYDAKVTSIEQINTAADNAKASVDASAVNASGETIHDLIDQYANQSIMTINGKNIDDQNALTVVQMYGNKAATDIQAIVDSAV